MVLYVGTVLFCFECIDISQDLGVFGLNFKPSNLSDF